MEAFLKRNTQNPPAEDGEVLLDLGNDAEESSTDLKIAILASLHTNVDQAILLDLLIAKEGSVEEVTKFLNEEKSFEEEEGVTSPRKRNGAVANIGYQTSLSTAFNLNSKPSDGSDTATVAKRRNLTRKGQTLHLYAPEDIANHTPCSIIHNFLPNDIAESLLRELLVEAPSYERITFKLFDNVVQSPHSACFYVEGFAEEERQRTEYLYNGSFLSDVRQITPQMRAVSPLVQEAVNKEIEYRIKHFYPHGKKLPYQSPKIWTPNAAFVNCYKGGSESVGYHSDQLTYLGPRAVIGSISLGVAREFRVRKIVARNSEEGSAAGTSSSAAGGTNDSSRADAEGQIAIHLPHNSLLVMHAEMQEEWKHSIAPAQVIDPHPLAGNKRINITYRHYRDSFHPKYTPRCKCNVATVLRCVQRKKESRGRYMWMCHAGNTPGKQGCSFFQWAEFDEDGEPPWVKKSGNRKETGMA